VAALFPDMFCNF
jgi:hypothetical protein